jgi:hypothetical protein
MCGLCAASSGDLLPPSPPAEKATARQDQAGKASTGDGRGHVHRRWVEQGRLDERADVSLRRTGVTREREHLGDLERRTREDTRQRHAVGSDRVAEDVLADHCPAAHERAAERVRCVTHQNLRRDGVAVLHRGHLARAPHRRERERVARQGALPRRVEVDRAALDRYEPVVERELERRVRSAQAARVDVPGRRDDHGDDLVEAEAGPDQQRVVEYLVDRRVRRDRARHRREYLDAGHAGRRVEVPDRHRVGVRWQGARQHGRCQQ